MYCTPSFGPSHLQVVLLPPRFAWSLQVRPDALRGGWFRAEEAESLALDVAGRLERLEQEYLSKEAELLQEYQGFCEEQERLWATLDLGRPEAAEALLEAPTGFAHGVSLNLRRRELRRGGEAAAAEAERWQERRWQELVSAHLPELGASATHFAPDERRQLLDQLRQRLAIARGQ